MGDIVRVGQKEDYRGFLCVQSAVDMLFERGIGEPPKFDEFADKYPGLAERLVRVDALFKKQSGRLRSRQIIADMI